MKILLVAAEVAPFAKVGGLADVAASLPLALRAAGHDVRVILPRYAMIDERQYGLQPVVRDLPVPLTVAPRATGAAPPTAAAVIEAAAQLVGEGQAEHTMVPVDVLQGALGRDGEVPVYFVRNAYYYDRPEVYAYPDDDERFLLFCRAALELLPRLDWWPDVIHCNDWHTGVLPNWLRTTYAADPRYAAIATIYTIHNLAYQGVFPADAPAVADLRAEGYIPPEVAFFPGAINLMARGLYYADVINTVSAQYAREILTPEYGERLDPLLRARRDRVFGILNGIDTATHDPASDAFLPHHYDAEHLAGKAANKATLQTESGLPVRPDVPVLAAISRFAAQKGFEIMVPMLDEVLPRHDAQFIILAIGNPEYEAQFAALAARFPAQVAFFRRFDAPLAQRIYGGADLFLMPSRFEPCGLGQMFAMRYGTVPVVRRTGGLADTVQDYDPATGAGSGFVFDTFHPLAFWEAVERALACYADRAAWPALVRHDMRLDWGWATSARKYENLYERALALHEEGLGQR